MSYKNFKNISEVCETFNLKYKEEEFIKTKKIIAEEYLFPMLKDFFNDNSSFASEAAISERIIFPIIYAVSKQNKLPVWSQLQFNVDRKQKLTGVPDFILAPALEGRKGFKLPVVCIGEAKKKDFDEGWGQVGAEMYAAQYANIKDKTDKNIIEKIKSIPIYGLVTDGKDWEFGQIIENEIIINKSKLVAERELQKLFDSLNWLISNASKNSIELLKI